MSSQETLTSPVYVEPVKERQLHLSSFLVIAIGISAGSIALININAPVGYYSIKAVQLILFFALGNLYISVKRNLLKSCPVEKQRSHILLITFLLCGLLLTLYIFFKKDAWLMAFSSSAAFILPYVLQVSWLLFTSIPGKEFYTYVPQEMVPGNTPVSLNSLVVRLKLKQHVSDVDEKVYTVFIPHAASLGDFFSRFITEHNTHVASLIENTDKHQNKYAWEFFEKSFYGLQSRQLDPYLTMAENKIKKDAVVYIKRSVLPGKLKLANKNLLNETIE